MTFSVHNLYSQMHFWSQVSPGGHLEGFEACLQRSPALRTRARNSLVFAKENQIFARSSLKNHRFFQKKIKDLNDHLKKVFFQMKIKDFNDTFKKLICFPKENQRFQR